LRLLVHPSSRRAARNARAAPRRGGGLASGWSSPLWAPCVACHSRSPPRTGGAFPRLRVCSSPRACYAWRAGTGTTSGATRKRGRDQTASELRVPATAKAFWSTGDGIARGTEAWKAETYRPQQCGEGCTTTSGDDREVTQPSARAIINSLTPRTFRAIQTRAPRFASTSGTAPRNSTWITSVSGPWIATRTALACPRSGDAGSGTTGILAGATWGTRATRGTRKPRRGRN